MYTRYSDLVQFFDCVFTPDNYAGMLGGPLAAGPEGQQTPRDPAQQEGERQGDQPTLPRQQVPLFLNPFSHRRHLGTAYEKREKNRHGAHGRRATLLQKIYLRYFNYSAWGNFSQ